MSYYYNGNYNAQSSANGGYPMRGGQGNGIPAHSVQHPQALRQPVYQQPPAPQQRPQAPPQQAPPPRQTLPAARAPPPPPIHFVLDRQYTLCRAPSPPAQPAAPTRSAPRYVPAQPTRSAPQHVPVAPPIEHYTPPRDGAHYAPTPSNGPRYVPPALRNAAHYTPASNTPHYTPAPNGAHYTPANPPPYTHYAPAPAAAPALVPFRCAHPQCGGRVVMVSSAREHMWAEHRVRV